MFNKISGLQQQMHYIKEGSEVFEKRFGEKLQSVPMILSADFNFNFADERNIPVTDFFNEALGLTMSNVRKLSTAKQFLRDIFINFNQTFSFYIWVTINLLYSFQNVVE